MSHACCDGQRSHLTYNAIVGRYQPPQRLITSLDQRGRCCSHEPYHLLKQQPPVAPLNQVSYRHRWQVVGMDCPSCARKIETLALRIPGVIQAKVLFTTETLVVDLGAGLSTDTLFAAVTAAGFELKEDRPSRGQVVPESRLQRVGHYWRPLLLAAMMLLAALLPSALSAPLFTFATLWAVWPIGKKAWRLIGSGSPFTIETLMIVAALGALYLGETAEAAMVLLLFMLGEHLEGYAAGRARAGVTALMALVPDRVIRIQHGIKEEITADLLRPGEIIELAPGDRLPVDARLQDGVASFDESALTGESVPVERYQDETVLAGSLVLDRVVRFSVVSEPGNNAIDRIIHLMEEAESERAPIERFIDHFSRWYTPAIMLIALLVVMVPPLLFGLSWDVWLYRGLALLLIGCPCALVMSTPAAITSALSAASQQGILIKGGAALERLAHVNGIAFDKTGTLTEGKPVLSEIISLTGQPMEQLLALASSIEQGSHHPLAKAIVAKAANMGLSVFAATELRTLAGVGVEGRIDGNVWQLLAPKWVTELSDSIAEQIAERERLGETVVVLCQRLADVINPIALLTLRDVIRAEAQEALQALHELGVTNIMLTGDNEHVAQGVGQQLAMEWRAGLLPADKVAEVVKLTQHYQVAMVGDGINDAPAMKRASVGIAMGGGTDVALESADAVISHNNLSAVATLIRLSRATLVNIRQNVAMALGLKAIFLVTTLFGVTGLWLAVLADTGATVLVTANALRLLRKR